MSTYTVMILMALFSLALAQVPEFSSLSATSFLVTPVQDPRLPSFFPWLRPTQPPVTRHDNYTYTSGNAGYKIHTQAVPWNDARLICEEEGGHLAVINSVAEANAITNLFAKSEPITGTSDVNYLAVGFHDLYETGEFVTIHGQSIAKAGYDHWSAGEPSGSGEHCGSLYINGRLNDINCAYKFGFICEKLLA